MDGDELARRATVQKRDIAAKLKNDELVEYLEKFFGESDFWSGKINSVIICREMLISLKDCFLNLSSNARLKFLLCLPYMSEPTRAECWKDLEVILGLSTQDSDEWIEMIAKTFSDLPEKGVCHKKIGTEDFSSDLKELKKLFEHHVKCEGVQRLPKAYTLATTKVLVKKFGITRPPVQHFVMKKKAKSYVFQQEIMKQNRELIQQKTSNTTAVSSSTLPIKMRSTQRIPDVKTPMRGIPTQNSVKLNSGFTNEPKKFQRALPQKKGGAMLLDINELPLSLKQRRQQETAENRNRKKEEKEIEKSKAAQFKKEREELRKMSLKRELEEHNQKHGKTQRRISQTLSSPDQPPIPIMPKKSTAQPKQPPNLLKSPPHVAAPVSHQTSQIKEPIQAEIPSEQPVTSVPVRVPSPQTYEQFEEEIMAKRRLALEKQQAAAAAVAARAAAKAKQQQEFEAQLALKKQQAEMKKMPAQLSHFPYLAQQQQQQQQTFQNAPQMLQNPQQFNQVAQPNQLQMQFKSPSSQQQHAQQLQQPHMIHRPQPLQHPQSMQLQQSHQQPQVAAIQQLSQESARFGQVTDEQRRLCFERHGDLFNGANALDADGLELIVSFLSGNTTNPKPDKGQLVTVKLSQHDDETVQDGKLVRRVIETFFQMDYANGDWRRLRRSRVGDNADSVPSQQFGQPQFQPQPHIQQNEQHQMDQIRQMLQQQQQQQQNLAMQQQQELLVQQHLLQLQQQQQQQQLALSQQMYRYQNQGDPNQPGPSQPGPSQPGSRYPW